MNKLKILFTSDIHGYISPYSYSNNKLEEQGLARLSKYIKDNKDDNTLLIDNGDILQGSPLTYYHHLYNEDNINPIALVYNHLGYDYFNIGNHDFNYGQDVLSKFINDIDCECITGNIKGNNTLENNYKIININDKKIGLIGVTNDYIPNWEIPDNILNLEFINSYEYTKDTTRYLKEVINVDYIIVVYHGGFEKNFDGSDLLIQAPDNCGYKMISEIEGIDLLLTGHQHRSFIDKINNTYIVQPTCNGKELIDIEIDLDTKVVDAKIIKAIYEIDTKVMSIIEELEKNTQVWLDQPLGSIKDQDCLVKDEINARINGHPVINFLNQIQLQHYNADISAMSLFNDAKGFNQTITTRDVVSTYVYPNTLQLIEITGKQLKEYLEHAARYFDIRDNKVVVSDAFMIPKPIHYEYDMIMGINYTVKVSNNIGQRIIEMKYKDTVVKDNDKFKMVINNYRYSGGGNYDILKQCKFIKEDGLEMVEIISEYIKNNTPIIIDPIKYDNIIN